MLDSFDPNVLLRNRPFDPFGAAAQGMQQGLAMKERKQAMTARDLAAQQDKALMGLDMNDPNFLQNALSASPDIARELIKQRIMNSLQSNKTQFKPEIIETDTGVMRISPEIGGKVEYVKDPATNDFAKKKKKSFVGKVVQDQSTGQLYVTDRETGVSVPVTRQENGEFKAIISPDVVQGNSRINQGNKKIKILEEELEETKDEGKRKDARLKIDEERAKISKEKAEIDKATFRNKVDTKLVMISTAKQQLNVIKSKWQAIKGTIFTGKGQKTIGSLSPKAKAFDASIDAIRSTIRGLTRVPGEGSMSDWEGRLDQAKLPDRGAFENVTEQQIQQLEDLIKTIDIGYSAMKKTGLPDNVQNKNILSDSDLENMTDEELKAYINRNN